MKLRIPEHIASLAPYRPGKPLEEVERELGLSNIAKLASNENPLGPSPLALAAARAALESAHRYPDGGGYYLTRKLSAISGVPPEGIVLGNGSTELVEILARIFTGGSGTALISEGAFVMYRIAVIAAGGRCRLVPMTPDRRHDLPAMADAIDPSTRIVYIANPNNPTGTYVGAQAFDGFLERVPEDIVVVVDEAYREYLDLPDYPESLPHLARGRPLVVLRTFSKIYGLAGLRIGYALTSREIASAMERARSPFNTSTVGQVAATAALDDEAHLGRSRESNAEGLVAVSRGLQALGVSYTPSVANFVLIDPPQDPDRLYEALLGLGVIVRPMASFGFPRSLRVSVGTAAENQRFLETLGRCLARRTEKSS